MTQPPDPPTPELLDQLAAYAAQPCGNRAVHLWTVDDLLTLFDPTVPVTAIMEALGVTRPVVTYELVRLRRAGFAAPDRPTGGERVPRTRAIEADLRAGMTDAEVARRHGVSGVRVWQVRVRAGIPVQQRAWTEAERTLVIAHQDRAAREVAAMVGRSVRAVEAERSRLIGHGRIRPKIRRPRRADQSS